MTNTQDLLAALFEQHPTPWEYRKNTLKSGTSGVWDAKGNPVFLKRESHEDKHHQAIVALVNQQPLIEQLRDAVLGAIGSIILATPHGKTGGSMARILRESADELRAALAALLPEASTPELDLVGGKLRPICETCGGTGRIPTYTGDQCPGNSPSAHDLTEPCPDCDRRGRRPEATPEPTESCERCLGLGWIAVPSDMRYPRGRRDCPDCDGTGQKGGKAE